jgi:hypothetical protein
VGGAYRTLDSGLTWTSVTDWIGMEDVNLTGIESIALDPNDPGRVYLAAGTYLKSGYGAMLVSKDSCRTFAKIAVPVTMGANEMGRGNGERLVVDPNYGRMLFFGSRKEGLWRSGDFGATWEHVAGFPEIPPADDKIFPDELLRKQYDVGIVSVAFDPASGKRGAPTPNVYAAASTNTVSIYRSLDCGKTWEPVPGQPVGLRPNHIVRSVDGQFYISYGKEPGPNFMTDGALVRFSPSDCTWTDITPEKPMGENSFGYGSVAVDPRNPDIIVTTSFCRYKQKDDIWRSADRGRTWKPMLRDAIYDHGNAPWTGDTFVHWMSDVEIDPFDSDRILFTTGYGIWGSVNATEADKGGKTIWKFLCNGLEECVPLGLASPQEGPHLLSAIGDYDGFRHDDLDVSPAHGQYKSPPRFQNSESLAIALLDPRIVVRSGNYSRDGSVLGAYSMDAGVSWIPFPSLPPHADGGGQIAVSADGKRIVLNFVKPGPYVTEDYGITWQPCKGLAGKFRIVADAVNQRVFYALDAISGRLYASDDGTLEFIAVDADISPVPDFNGGFGGDGGPGVMLFASPASEGDLWLAFRKQGMRRSCDSGRTWSDIDEIHEAYTMGFGKAAPGKSYPSIFLAGKVDGLIGLFRSDDEGVSWVRINDDKHQFGWINHVTGDPRIFGRVYFGTGGRGIIYGDKARK